MWRRRSSRRSTPWSRCATRPACTWFEGKFGEAYTPLQSTAEAVSRFVSPLFAVGVKLEPDDGLGIVAPYGLEDLFALRLRPNPARPEAKGFARAAASAAERWPELKIIS